MGRKITQFQKITSALGTDLIPLVRASEPNLADRNKSIAVEDLIDSGNSSTSDAVFLPGTLSCKVDCPVGGKSYEFYNAQTSVSLTIQVGFDMQILPGASAIQIHRWTQPPNENYIGRVWYANLPHTGGTISLTVTSSTRWISIFAVNPDKFTTYYEEDPNDFENQIEVQIPGAYDGVCFDVHGNIITLVSF